MISKSWLQSLTAKIKGQSWKYCSLKKLGRGALTLKDAAACHHREVEFSKGFFAKAQSHLSVEVIENDVDGLT